MSLETASATANREVVRADLYEVVLVFNGPLDMSDGKMTGQAFQAAFWMASRWSWPSKDEYEWLRNMNISTWIQQGTRTISKIAKTPAIFKRVCAEVPGFVMMDEGFTEVGAGAATLFAAYPVLHKNRPKVLDNKKVVML